jgi:hypothetical protein
VHFETDKLTSRVHEILRMHEKLVKLIAGRESNEHLSWSSIRENEPPYGKGAVLGIRRDRCILSPRNTCYEFRPFRSSVEDQTFFARLELTQALVEFSNMTEPVEDFPQHMKTYENLKMEMVRLGV